MKQAILLGKQAQGLTGDNPYVGCVLVKNGCLIGEGFTQAPGEAHAEVMAINNAEKKAKSLELAHELFEGVTLYSTVEPCSFHGRTPACSQTILEKKITHVVVGICDPHPQVNGEGIRILRDAGVKVEAGICESEVREYLKDWLETFQDEV